MFRGGKVLRFRIWQYDRETYTPVALRKMALFKRVDLAPQNFSTAQHSLFRVIILVANSK